jgi:hypothetical protein
LQKDLKWKKGEEGKKMREWMRKVEMKVRNCCYFEGK